MNVRKTLLAVLLAAAAPITLHAQTTMTDDQIVEMVKAERQAGTGDKQIAAKLMQKGVSIERLQELRAKMTGEATSVEEGKEEMVVADISRVENTQKTSIADREAAESDESGIFGHDIFNNNKISFEPNMNIATPDDYRLGPGDEVYIEVFGASQKTITGKITPDGNITVDYVGPVQLAGLTVAQANARLRQQLGGIYSDSRIQMYVGQTKTIMVQVMGEVNFPGTYTVSAFASVFHGLYMAGGPNNIGTLRDIKVYRNERLVANVDVYDYILNGKLSGNIRLKDNDVIVVSPYKALVQVAGKVKRPMFYEMKESESVRHLIDYAGGFTGDAFTEDVLLVRNATNEKTVYNVTYDEMGGFTLMDRDFITVGEKLDRYANRIEIKGAVFRPGTFQVGGRINTVRELVDAAKGLTEIAAPERAILQRRRADRTLETQTINLAAILNGSEADIALRKDDELFVPTRMDQMQDLYVVIYGEVFTTGRYPYAEGLTLENLIMQAGGLNDKASITRIDVSRRKLDPKATATSEEQSEWFSLTLQDGFIVSGDAGFELKPYDHVYVRRSPVSEAQKTVYVEGEILFTGNYALTTSKMRLSDLVKLAGGLRPQAYAAGARLIRRATDEERLRMQEALDQMKHEMTMAMAEQQTNKARAAEDSLYAHTIEQLEVEDNYSVGIDLDKALKDPGSAADILLRDGDHLIVPELVNTISIAGEVAKQNNVTYIPGQSLKKYIEKAGGYTERAKKSHAYIIHANGNMSKAKTKNITPGCEIVVPMKLTNKRSLAEILSIGTAATSLATMSASIANILK